MWKFHDVCDRTNILSISARVVAVLILVRLLFQNVGCIKTHIPKKHIKLKLTLVAPYHTKLEQWLRLILARKTLLACLESITTVGNWWLPKIL